MSISEIIAICSTSALILLVGGIYVVLLIDKAADKDVAERGPRKNGKRL